MLRRLFRPASRIARQERGAQLVEFAIVVPVFLLLVMGIIDFGRAYFSWIIITNGAREGARVAAVGGDVTAVEDRVESAITGLARNAAPVCPPLADQDWCVETVNLQGTRGNPVTVQVRYNFRYILPAMANLTSNVFSFNAESTMRLE